MPESNQERTHRYITQSLRGTIDRLKPILGAPTNGPGKPSQQVVIPKARRRVPKP